MCLSQAIPPVIILDVVNEELETITTHIIRPLTEGDVVECVIQGDVTRIAWRESTTALAPGRWPLIGVIRTPAVCTP